jgi:hypothetical protein
MISEKKMIAANSTTIMIPEFVWWNCITDHRHCGCGDIFLNFKE